MSLRTWYAGLDRNARRVVITLTLLVMVWIVRAFVEEAKLSDPNTPENREIAGFTHDSTRACADSVFRASPEKCFYYRRPPYFRQRTTAP